MVRKVYEERLCDASDKVDQRAKQAHRPALTGSSSPKRAPALDVHKSNCDQQPSAFTGVIQTHLRHTCHRGSKSRKTGRELAPAFGYGVVYADCAVPVEALCSKLKRSAGHHIHHIVYLIYDL
jgi:hypothetical protein